MDPKRTGDDSMTRENKEMLHESKSLQDGPLAPRATFFKKK